MHIFHRDLHITDPSYLKSALIENADPETTGSGERRRKKLKLSLFTSYGGDLIYRCACMSEMEWENVLIPVKAITYKTQMWWGHTREVENSGDVRWSGEVSFKDITREREREKIKVHISCTLARTYYVLEVTRDREILDSASHMHGVVLKTC